MTGDELKNQPPKDYKWLTVAYVSFALCILFILFLLAPKIDTNEVYFLIIISMLAYIGASLSLCIKALKRLEAKIENFKI